MDIGTIRGDKIRNLLEKHPDIKMIKYIPYNGEIVLYFYEKQLDEGIWFLWNEEILKDTKISIVKKLVENFIKATGDLDAISIKGRYYLANDYFDDEESLKEFLAEFCRSVE